MLWAILDAHTNGDQQRLNEALGDVDVAVVAGLQALGFQRGPIRALTIRRLGALGLKRPTCELEIDSLELRHALTIARRPDDVIETWIHESSHARTTPWAADYHVEMVDWKGYEEGLAEGCAKSVAGLGALTGGTFVYERYCKGYEYLADALGVTREDLYRHFWPHQPGTVRRAFTDAVDDLYHQNRGRHLALQQRRDIQDLADEIFDSDRQDVFDPVLARQIEREWRRRLP